MFNSDNTPDDTPLTGPYYNTFHLCRPSSPLPSPPSADFLLLTILPLNLAWRPWAPSGECRSLDYDPALPSFTLDAHWEVRTGILSLLPLTLIGFTENLTSLLPSYMFSELTLTMMAQPTQVLPSLLLLPPSPSLGPSIIISDLLMPWQWPSALSWVCP